MALSRVSDSGKKKKLLLIILSSFLLLATIIAVISGVATLRNSDDSPSHTIIKSSCSPTLYPDLCFSSIASAPGLNVSKISSQRDVIDLSLNLTTLAVQRSYFKVEKMLARPKLTPREKTALHDCLEMIDESLDELHKTADDFKIYPKQKSLSQHAEDLKILISGAMTNQESCMDGFSHDRFDKEIRKELITGLTHVHKLCSNALAMIKNMTDTDMAIEQAMLSGRRLGEKADEFPSWLSAGDRRLLQASTVTPNVVVAADGSGNYRTVSAAVAAAPERSNRRYVIRIKAGVYRENVEVTKRKTNLMFVGDGRTNTIITGNRNVVDGSTTFKSATVAVIGEGFLARDITFENTAGPSKHQAVALRVNADLTAFYRCDMLAYQDTLYVHSLRQYYRDCIIAGTVDFIFGNAAVVFQNCDIHARRPNSGQKNMVTAQGRDDPNQNTGITIEKCRIGATSDLLPVRSSFPSYLGRPWKEYSRTVIMRTEISDVIHPAGWYEWNGNFALNTLFYAEYQNTGAGAGTGNRVKWRGFKVITSATEAQQYTVGRFIQGSNWLGATGFPFDLGI